MLSSHADSRNGCVSDVRIGNIFHATMLDESVEIPYRVQPVATGDHLVGCVQIDPVIQEFKFTADLVYVFVDVIAHLSPR